MSSNTPKMPHACNIAGNWSIFRNLALERNIIFSRWILVGLPFWLEGLFAVEWKELTADWESQDWLCFQTSGKSLNLSCVMKRWVPSKSIKTPKLHCSMTSKIEVPKIFVRNLHSHDVFSLKKSKTAKKFIFQSYIGYSILFNVL